MYTAAKTLMSEITAAAVKTKMLIPLSVKRTVVTMFKSESTDVVFSHADVQWAGNALRRHITTKKKPPSRTTLARTPYLTFFCSYFSARVLQHKRNVL